MPWGRGGDSGGSRISAWKFTTGAGACREMGGACGPDLGAGAANPPPTGIDTIDGSLRMVTACQAAVRDGAPQVTHPHTTPELGPAGRIPLACTPINNTQSPKIPGSCLWGWGYPLAVSSVIVAPPKEVE